MNADRDKFYLITMVYGRGGGKWDEKRPLSLYIESESPGLRQKPEKIFASECSGREVAVENRIRKRPLPLLERIDFFLDRFFGDEARDQDGISLADPVGAVRGLGLD